MECPDDDDLSSYLAGVLRGDGAMAIAAHLPICALCSAVIEALGTPRPEAAPTQPARPGHRGPRAGEPRAGDSIGKYVLGQRVGAGGMGVVWAAYDADLDRQVAIKLVREPRGGLARRFEREVRITAKLQHPSIVGVFEAGTLPTGAPYYVMKLVRGEALDRMIAARGTLAERLALLPSVIAVVDALAYAHRAGVIHRDLKPDNVLVGEFGETVVIDWGLAKALDERDRDDDDPDPIATSGDATAAGAVMGTPAYMPPEQALGEPVDARADVYALGAMLYHLLGGRRPYAEVEAPAILDAVIAGPPAPLAAVGIPADLSTIVGQAMARDPAARYPTAKELGAQLKRFQTGQLVASHHYSAGELVRRWLGRHRGAVTVAALAVVALVTVAAISVRRIGQQRRIAEQRQAEAEEMLDYMVFDLRDRLKQIGRLDLMGAVARKASTYVERSDDHSIAALHRKQAMHANLGDVLAAEGDSKAALASYRTSLSYGERVAARDPANPSFAHALGVSHSNIGDVLVAQGDLAGALGEYRLALAIDERVAAAEPATLARQAPLALDHQKLGDVLLRQNAAKEALAEQRIALAIAEAVAAGRPDDAEAQDARVAQHAKVGVALMQLDPAAALGEYRTALGLLEPLARATPANLERQRNLAGYHSNIGAILFDQGHPADAVVEGRAALAISTRLAAQDPTNTALQRDVSATHENVADALLALGDADGALLDYRAGLEIAVALAARDPDDDDWQRDLAKSYFKLAAADLAAKRPLAAEASYRGALAVAERALAKDPDNAEWRDASAQLRQALGALPAVAGP